MPKMRNVLHFQHPHKAKDNNTFKVYSMKQLHKHNSYPGSGGGRVLISYSINNQNIENGPSLESWIYFVKFYSCEEKKCEAGVLVI